MTVFYSAVCAAVCTPLFCSCINYNVFVYVFMLVLLMATFALLFSATGFKVGDGNTFSTRQVSEQSLAIANHRLKRH